MSTSTLRVIEISKQGHYTYVVVSDGKESERNSFEENNAFREESEKFLKEKYGEYLSISNSIIDHQGETVGNAWVSVTPKSDGIIEMIAEEYGLEIEVVR